MTPAQIIFTLFCIALIIYGFIKKKRTGMVCGIFGVVVMFLGTYEPISKSFKAGFSEGKAKAHAEQAHAKD